MARGLGSGPLRMVKIATIDAGYGMCENLFGVAHIPVLSLTPAAIALNLTYSALNSAK